MADHSAGLSGGIDSSSTGPSNTPRVRRGTTNISNTLPAAAHVDGGFVPRINPAIKPLVDLYPLPNASGDRYTFLFTEPASDPYGQVRMDANVSANSTVFGRYTVTDGDKTAATFFPGTRRMPKPGAAS